MPRTAEELEQAAADAEAWLDSLDPDDLAAEDTSDLRAIAKAVADIGGAQHQLVNAVGVARKNGWSWGRIGMALGVSRQAARQHYAELVDI